MVIDRGQRSAKKPIKQGVGEDTPEPIKIGASTPYDFDSKNLTAYGGLLPVATMLEKLQFQQLVEETLTVKRETRAMPWYQFVLSMVLALYVGFSRLHHLRFLAREPMLIGILKVLRLPPQCTFWRFLASLHGSVAQQLLVVHRQMRQRVWEAAHIKLTAVTLDTDTTVHTVYGKQMGARKSYNPKNRGKKSYQPILTFLAETKEYVGGELHNGDRPSGIQLARHIESMILALPHGVKIIEARADSGLYCWEVVQTYEKHRCRFIVVARKTPRLLEELKSAHWKRSPGTDADEQCEFRYQPQGWGRAYRFIALRYEKKAEPGKQEESEQYQLFETTGVHLSGFCNQHARAYRYFGLVLPATRQCGKPDQGSQQRCRVSRASLESLGHELCALPTGHAGLQPELLAVTVQPGRESGSRRDETYATVDDATAFSVSGGQDLESLRKSGR